MTLTKSQNKKMKIKYCEKCVQMTNHIGDKCLKCNSSNSKQESDPGPCYRCHQWPCKCKEGPLMEKPSDKDKSIREEIIEIIEQFYYRCSPTCIGCEVELDMMASSIISLYDERLQKLIVDEILIARKEGFPTSRLTSLFMKVKQFKEDR